MKKILILFFIISFFLPTLIRPLEAGFLSAPDFSLEDIDGRNFTLSDYKGQQKLLLLFWTTWCPNCRRALRTLAKKKGNYKIITIDIQESKDRVEKFLKANAPNLTVLLDKDGEVASAYGIFGIPAYILIDQDLKISYKGYTFPRQLDLVP